jgi:predicted acylesterase/phospholipase RssA
MPRSREVRMGVVLYGGVSLAIYENGVAQELYRAVRGEGVYALLKDLIDSELVVDIISGTSAGGINGLMLGYALANQRNFRTVANLWRDQGDIERLLRSPQDPNAVSLLDSEGFYQPHLEDAFRGMGQPDASLAVSDVEELDVFITGTNVAGHVETVFDDQGHAIDIKDHRAVFKLQFRQGRVPPKNDFEAAGNAELALLARLTSCFPAAFAPVLVGKEQPLLRRWGKMSRPAVFLDGGILDNKPFSYTIDTITSRTAGRDVERLLFYLEPDPERFAQPATAPPIPSLAGAALDSVAGMPRYQSIADDLRAIAAHNDRVRRVEELLECLPEAPAPGPDCPQRLQAEDLNKTDWCVYVTSRLMQLRERAIQGILNDPTGRGFFSTAQERRAARLLVESFNHWQGDPLETLTSFDVFFRQRLLAHLSYSIRDYLDEHRPQAAVRERYQALWEAVNHYYKLSEIVRWAMESWIDQATIAWRPLDAEFPEEPAAGQLAAISADKWGQVAQGFTRLLSTTGLEIPTEQTREARGQFYLALAARLAQLPAGDVQGNLLQALDAAIRQMLLAHQADLPDDAVLREFCRFLQVDRIVFPLQFAAGSPSRDPIHVVRLSPVDAQRGLSARSIDHKVCGRSLGAFGGFFKKPWRANDILWGRLDGLCEILECTLTRVRARKVWPGGGPALGAVAAQIQQLFPNSPQLHGSLAAQLAGIGTLNQAQFESLLSDLITAAQTEIAAEEWPRVMASALEQERSWSQYRRQAGLPAPGTIYAGLNLVWKPGNTDPDRIVVALAAQALAAGQLPNFQQFDIAGRPFLEELPKPVLLELGARAMGRLGRSLTASIPSQGVRKKIEGSWLYGLIFGWILPIASGWAKLVRTAPAWRVSINVFILTACLLALIGGVVLLALSLVHQTLPQKAYALMILIPLVVLAVWGWIFRR